MATSVELATGYVTLAVETSRVAAQVGRAFSGVERTGAAAGRNMGQAMAQGWAKTKPDMSALAADVTRAEERATAAVKRNAAEQEAAKRKVEIAQAKVSEATEKYGAKSSQALSAVDRLATAEGRLEAQTLKAKTQQEKLNQELTEAKDAYTKAQAAASTAATESGKSAEKYARGWRGVGQRIRGFLVGGVRNAVGAADSAADGGRGASKYAAGWRGVGQRLKGYLANGMREANARAERDADQGGKRAGGGFATAFKGALGGLAAYAGVQQIGQQLWSGIQGAGDLEQSVGAIDSVFKQSAGQMNAWAKSSSDAVGLSANEFNELGTLIGSQLKNGGLAMDQLAPKTNELIGLGADMSSMFGGTTREAVEALSSALKGESDPIEAYGVTLSAAKVEAKAAAMGFEKVGGSLTDEGKQAATLALIMDQTKDAHGNFARESDTFAHKQQVMAAKWVDLKAAMGEVFLPVLTKVFGFIGEKALPAITNFAGGIKAFTAAWVANDGDITSSGFAGFMEQTAFVLRGVYDALRNTVQWWGPFAIGVGVAAAALGAWLVVSKGYLFAAAATIAKNYALAASWVAANWPIMAVVAGIALVVGALILAYNKIGWFRDAVDWAFNAVQAIIGAVVNWWTTTAWPALMAGFQAIGTAVVWLWQNVMVPAWAGISAAIGTVVGWLAANVLPVLQAALAAIGTAAVWLWQNVMVPAWAGIQLAVQVAGAVLSAIWQGLVWTVQNVLAPVFTWLWQNVLVPAWGGIKIVVAAVAAVLMTIWQGLVWTVQNVLAPVFTWLWQSIIVPVWNGIRGAIAAAWAFIRDSVFAPLRGFITGPLAGTFRWFRDNLITPVWDGIRNTINAGWVFIRDKVFAPLKSAIMDSVPKAFRTGRDAIKKVWDALEGVAKKPVKFVVQTVINDGLISNFNKIATKVGVKPLPSVALPKGFDRGGWTGPGSRLQPAGVVHADEFVVKKSSRRDVESNAPGLLDAVNGKGYAGLRSYLARGYADGGWVWPVAAKYPITQHPNSGHMAYDIGTPVGTRVNAAAKGRVAHAGPGTRVGGVWGGNEVHLDHGSGIYTWYAHLSRILVKTGQIVEKGAQIALSGNTGVSSGPHLHFEAIRGGEYNLGAGRGSFDPRSAGLVASGAYSADGGGILSALYEKFLAPLVNWGKNALTKVREAVPGAGMWVDMAAGAGKNLVNGAREFIMDKINIFGGGDEDAGGGDVERWRDTITAALRRTGLPDNRTWQDAWLRQVKSESNGNPRAVQSGYVDVNTGGNEAMGLLQVTGSTWRAYRDPELPNDRFNPLASATAGMRWAKARYGVDAILRVIGHGHGYAEGGRVAPAWRPQLFDKGGMIREGLTLIDHQRSQPDRVLTAEQWRTMSTIAEESQRGRSAPLVGVLQALDLDEALQRLAYEERKREVLHR